MMTITMAAMCADGVGGTAAAADGSATSSAGTIDLEKLLKPIAAWVTGVILATGYGGIVLLMAIESACIPLPSEVIMPFSGYLVSQGKLGLHGVSWAGALGCALGSAVAYAVGVWGGRPFVERYGRYVLIRRKDLDRADAWFARWGGWAVFVSRLLPVVRTFISLPAGIARMPFVPFLVLSFVGSLPWCYLLAYVGLVLGKNWASIKTYFHGADAVIGVVVVLAFGVWLWHHLRPEKAEQNQSAAEQPAPSDATAELVGPRS